MAGASPMALRSAWRDMLQAVGAHGRAVLDGARYDRVGEASLAHQVITVTSSTFPLDDAPAQALAGAFKLLSRSLVATTGDERRLSLARAVMAAATELEEMLVAAQVAASQAWQGQSGGAD